MGRSKTAPETKTKDEKLKKKIKYRVVPKSEWQTYIVRLVKSENCRLHNDSVQILNNLVNTWLDDLTDRAAVFLKQDKRETYTRKLLRSAYVSLCEHNTKLAEYTLKNEQECYDKFKTLTQE